MVYREQYKKTAQEEIDTIFRKLLPKNGLRVREAQIRLSHQMLHALMNQEIALCDAGVGIGKTYAYLVACIIMQKYASKMGVRNFEEQYAVVVSTSSITLQKAILKEYIPFLSKILVRNQVITSPLRAVVRKGKEHFVCDQRLEQRISAIKGKAKNAYQREALLLLRTCFDMDEVHGISSFDRKQVCVPKFCPRDCAGKNTCRYQRYLRSAKEPDVFIQICNHNYLLADAVHRSREYRPLLRCYRALVVDEAHKLQEAAMQMYGKTITYEYILELCSYLEKEHQRQESRYLLELMEDVLENLKKSYQEKGYGKLCFSAGKREGVPFQTAADGINQIRERLKGSASRWLLNRLEETEEIFYLFQKQAGHHVFYLQKGKSEYPSLCMASRDVPKLLERTLWQEHTPAILTSGTLRAGQDFFRTRQATGLEKKKKVREYVAESPFHYKKNCLLFLPKDILKVKRGSQMEVALIAKQIYDLIMATNGHTLVLFTSYTLMSGVYQILKDALPFELVEAWRHAQEEITRFKSLDNGVLFAAGSCWEGVDFPGDMVSSLIIVKLPFAVPDPITEAEKETYGTLDDYIASIIVPDMQKKLRQGFGRAIRTEQDTCVVSILDNRAVQKGRYHKEVMEALPDCKVTEQIEEVRAFIRARKSADYYKNV